MTLRDHVSKVKRKQTGALGRSEMATVQAPVWQARAKCVMYALFYLTLTTTCNVGLIFSSF